MEFKTYTSWEQFPDKGNILFKKGEKESMFFSRPWFENIVNTAITDEQQMILACVIEQEKVLAILPLMKKTDEHWCSLKHRYSSDFTVLIEEKYRLDILSCLVQGLGQLPFQFLDLEPFDENNRDMHDMQKIMESYGFNCHRSFRFYNWINKIQDQSFTQFMASRPAKVRNTIARKERKLSREHHYETRLFKANEVQQAMNDYHTVYQSSWKANELFKKIVDGLAIRFAHENWTRLAILYIDDQPAAAQLWFVVHSKAYIFRLSYDEAWKKYSPGSILSKYLMEYVIDIDGVEEIDFLTGNEAYKQDWMSERRERWALVCSKDMPAKKQLLSITALINYLKKIKFTGLSTKPGKNQD